MSNEDRTIIKLRELAEIADTLVHCKECKYWVSDGGALMLCDIHKDPTVPEHFCSYGERDSEKPNNSEGEDIPMEYFENGGI